MSISRNKILLVNLRDSKKKTVEISKIEKCSIGDFHTCICIEYWRNRNSYLLHSRKTILEAPFWLPKSICRLRSTRYFDLNYVSSNVRIYWRFRRKVEQKYNFTSWLSQDAENHIKPWQTAFHAYLQSRRSYRYHAFPVMNYFVSLSNLVLFAFSFNRSGFSVIISGSK